MVPAAKLNPQTQDHARNQLRAINVSKEARIEAAARIITLNPDAARIDPLNTFDHQLVALQNHHLPNSRPKPVQAQEQVARLVRWHHTLALDPVEAKRPDAPQ